MTAMTKKTRFKPNGPAGLTRIEPPDPSSATAGFVDIVSHDLRNAARALTEVPQWLREDLTKQGVPLGTDVAENLELLERHARRLDRMLLDLLVYSRVGRLQSVTEVPLRDLIGDVQADCTPPAHVRLRIDGDLPHLSMGPRDAFVLVSSILDNVIKHGPPGGVTLTVSGSRCSGVVTLTFTDDGHGVSNSDIQRIFQPMTTLRRRDEVEGSGMGLAIVQRIAGHYGGDVWAGAGAGGRGFALRVRLVDATPGDTGSGPVDTATH